MTLSLYLTIQQIVMSAILALGCHLIFARMPKRLKGSRIHISGQIIGAAMTILPIAGYIYCFADMKSLGAQYATAVNLTAYCITSTLISLAYHVLLEHTEDKGFIKIHIGLAAVYPFPLWFGLCFGSEFIARHILIASYTLFCILAIVHISTCLYFYRQRYVKCRDNMSDLERLEFKLIGRTIYISMAMIVVATYSASFFSYPMWLGFIFIGYFTGATIYIYVCYHKILYSNIDSLIPSNEELFENTIEEELKEENLSTAVISEDTKTHIEKYLQMWVDKKEFVQPTTSINSVAQALCTNRTYLSRYINTTYHCTFKTWITQLKIEESKRLMREHPERSLSQIATQAGFTSVASFSHIFTRYEQLTPSVWREANL